MTGALQDLWPKEIEVTEVLNPLTILRFQADQLKKRTKEILEAEVQTQIHGKWVKHSFDLIAPLLNGYRYRLFSVKHMSEMIYPVTVDADCLLDKSIREQIDLYDADPATIDWPTASTQEEFVELIRRVLQSPETKSVIQSLIARSNDVTRERQTAKTVKSEPK